MSINPVYLSANFLRQIYRHKLRIDNAYLDYNGAHESYEDLADYIRFKSREGRLP